MITQTARIADVLLRFRIGSIVLFLPAYLVANHAKMYPLAPIALGVVLIISLLEQLALWGIHHQGGRAMFKQATSHSAAMDMFAFSLFAIISSLHHSLHIQLIAVTIPTAFIVCMVMTKWFSDTGIAFKTWLAVSAHITATVMTLQLTLELTNGQSTYLLFGIVLAYGFVVDRRLNILMGIDKGDG